MRRLLPTARSFLIHSGQTVGLLMVATLAMAAAPQAMMQAVDAPAPAPDARPSAPEVVAAVEPAGPPVRIMQFLAPVSGYDINSSFGRRYLSQEAHARQHKGVDIAAPMGTPVTAAAEGVVTAAGRNGGYGNFVEVRHPNGLRTFYAHLSRIDVRAGSRVEAGQGIGRVGSTGYSTGPHLHFEVRRGGQHVNPARYIGREFAIELTTPTTQG
jgi:murein DD-endopeptidase MepM/ murein hydrolase activator NlpD